MFFKFIKFSGSGWQELFRYTVCGTSATVADSSLLYALESWSGFDYLISAALAFLLGAGISYFLTTRWAFKNYHRRQLNQEKLVFFFIMAVGFVGNELIIYHFGAHEVLWSKSLSIIIITAWNFMAKKLMLFNHPTLTKTAS